MDEQIKRFRGLRRVTKEQEGLRSPSYQVHKLHFDFAEFTATGFSERKFEIEATDLWFPYHRDDFFQEAASPAPRFPLVELEFFLNESKDDLISIDRYHVPQKITNFPFYKITIRLTHWTQGPGEETLPFKFYTFTDPRIIQALGARV